MGNLFVVLLFFSVLKLCVNLEHIWHSYQHDPIHQSREELVIINITSDDQFKVEHVVKKWKSVQVEKTCFLAGVMTKSVVIASVRLNAERTGFLQKSYTIDLEHNLTDVALFEYWNSSSQDTNVMLVVATQKPELLWYRINETDKSLFWSWSTIKNISHINIFQMNYDYQLLIINTYLSHVTADWYQIQLKEPPNFWLRQKLELSDFASSSTVVSLGADYFLGIPQKSIGSLLIYKLKDNHFLPYKNLTSQGINQVISFQAGHKSFLAFNGLNAGIYQLTAKELLKKTIIESHLDGVNYWLPIPIPVYENDVILMAQRILRHGQHNSFVIELITYNGDKFEEHEDISCSFYGEEALGLICLPDEETGVAGSTSIFLDGILGLLIPRKNKGSELFIVETILRKVSNPLDAQIEEFSQKKQNIEHLIKNQEDRYNEIVGQSQEFDLFKIKAFLDEMEEDLNSMERVTLPHYSSIIFKGPSQIESGAVFEEVKVETINGEPAISLLDDIVLKSNIGAIEGRKVFRKLEVEDLICEKVNGIDSDDLLFTTENITVDGNLFLSKPFIVGNITTNKVNNITFEKEVVDFETPIDSLVFDNLEILGDASIDKINNFSLSKLTKREDFQVKSNFDTLFVPLNVEVEKVNGIDFDKFLKQLCLKNLRNFIPGTVRVKGDVRIEEDAETNYLNQLKFPLEYVFVDNTFPNITGIKHFTALTTSEINCEGTIDNIKPSQIITLSTPQNITGITTFKNLKITESLNVDGNITGEHASKFLPNPTLLDVNLIKAKVNFKNVEVDGVVVLLENFNGKHFESTLSDIIYVDEEKPTIEALKQFPEGLTVRTNLLISSNRINNVNINSIVTKNTDQNLNLTKLSGIVNFDNVEIEGSYDGVDIKKLDEELVKLDGEQFISATLIFEDQVYVNELKVVQTLREDFVDKNSSMEIEHVVVEGNIYGTIDGFDLQDYDNRRMSFSRNQTIDGEISIEQMAIKNMVPGKINDVDLDQFTNEAYKDKFKSRLLLGNLSVSNFYTESIDVDLINNKPATFSEKSFWDHDLNKYNITKLTFRNDIYMENVNIEKLSGVDFDRFIRNVVFKNESDVNINGRKTFLQGISVKKLIETQKINNVFLPNILTKHGEQSILGPLTIQGDVLFEDDVTVSESINQVPVETIADIYQVSDNQYEIAGDILFDRLPHIDNLEIQGYVDDRQVQEVVDGIIYTHGDFELKGQITFESQVNVEKNVRVTGKINNIDLPSFVSDMVMITKDATIESSVKFTQPVVVEDQIMILNSLRTEIDFQSWIDEAVFINKGFLKGRYMFENAQVIDSLRTDYINDIMMTTLIPLRTHQNLTELSFKEISLFKDVNVGNSTNHYNLPEEFANSVLTNSNQYIDSNVEFLGNVFIEGDLEVTGLINELETNRIVTTNSNQELGASYNFKSKINLEKDLVVEGLVNGIDIKNWSRDAVKVSAQNPQNITDNWMVEHDLIFEEDSLGSGLINGIDFRKFGTEIEEKKNHKYEIEKGFIDDYINICKDLTYMYDKLKSQIYKFSYLENLQILNLQDKIEYVYNFGYRNHNYLVINERKNCESYLFIFDHQGYRYVKNLPLGYLAQIISTHINNFTYLIIRNQQHSTCKVQKTNLWQIIDGDFVHLANIDDQDLLQESLIPGTFYGISRNVVTEFNILPDLDSKIRKYRKWVLKESVPENLAFVPRGFETSLALRNGRKIISLNRDDRVVDNFGLESEEIIIGDYTEEFNPHFPGRNEGAPVVLKVGSKSAKKNLLAVASTEETSVRGSLDFIKIYEDVITGRLFQKLPTYKPSSLVTLEFNNGETLLAFMEDESILQVYEYKGIEGFKYKLSAKLKGSKLFTTTLKLNKIIGLVDRNKISFLEAVMLGSQIEEGLRCNL